MRVPQVNERVKGAPVHALRAMFAGIGQVLGMTDKLRAKSAPVPADPEKVVSDTPAAPAAGTVAEPAAETSAGSAAMPEAAAPEAAVPVTAATATAEETPAMEPEAAAVTVVPAETATTPAPVGGAASKPKAAPRPRAAAKPKAAAKPARPEVGGHVRLLSPDELAAPATATAETAPAETAPATATAETATAETATAETATAETATAETAPVAETAFAPATATAETATAETATAETAPVAALPLANYDELTIASLRARLRNLSADQLGQLIAYEKGHAAREDVITMFERRVAKLAEG